MLSALDAYSLHIMERTLEQTREAAQPTLRHIIGAWKACPARRLELESRFYDIAGMVLA